MAGAGVSVGCGVAVGGSVGDGVGGRVGEGVTVGRAVGGWVAVGGGDGVGEGVAVRIGGATSGLDAVGLGTVGVGVGALPEPAGMPDASQAIRPSSPTASGTNGNQKRPEGARGPQPNPRDLSAVAASA